MALDRELLEKAKQEFGKKFCPKIVDLGYNLSPGVIEVPPQIIAIIQSSAPIVEALRREIEEAIPKQYVYEGHNIEVIREYVEGASFL